MDLELNGKRVLITGGSRGIGLACARAFLREGARVTLIGRSEANLAAAVISLAASVGTAGTVGTPGGAGTHGGATPHTIAADLTDAAQAARAVDAAASAMGDIDILVTSAGAARRTPPAELTPQAWRDAMDAKYFSYLHIIDPVIKRMALAGSGAIVNVVGMGGKVASPTHLPGGAANAALMLATAGLASAYGRSGVRVNAVNPSATHTERLQQGLEAEAKLAGTTVDEALRYASARTGLGRLAAPEEIADAVLFLASARATYISGAILSIDGATTPLVV